MTRLLDFAACLPQCPACPKAKGHAKCLPAPKKHSAALELQKFRCLPACLNRLCRAHLPALAKERNPEASGLRPESLQLRRL